MKLSIIIPAYNEAKTLSTVLERVRLAPLPDGWDREIVVIDDASTDGTKDLIKLLSENGEVRAFYFDINQGKGAAVRRGLKECSGDAAIIQDADLEYNPNDYPRLLEPLIDGRADVVFGSRFVGSEAKRVLYFWHFVGNRILTTFSNMLTSLNLTDMEVCYKLLARPVIEAIKDNLMAKRFGIEPEITARVASGRWRVYEVGISYSGRTYEEGKKINWRDGIAAFWHIIRFNWFD